MTKAGQKIWLCGLIVIVQIGTWITFARAWSWNGLKWAPKIEAPIHFPEYEYIMGLKKNILNPWALYLRFINFYKLLNISFFLILVTSFHKLFGENQEWWMLIFLSYIKVYFFLLSKRNKKFSNYQNEPHLLKTSFALRRFCLRFWVEYIFSNFFRQGWWL